MLTTFPDPAPALRRVRKQLVKYQRADGVALSFTLYLPPEAREGERLPALLWAYPQEFTLDLRQVLPRPPCGGPSGRNGVGVPGCAPSAPRTTLLDAHQLL